MPAPRINLVSVLALAICSAAAAKTPGQTPPPLQPLDQTVEDRGPLSTSFRDTAIELRLPNNFQQVMRVPGRPDLLMRVSGAVHAVFDESVYSSPGARGARSQGPFPLIPPGTVFYIGLPPHLSGLPQFQTPHISAGTGGSKGAGTADSLIANRLSHEVDREIQSRSNGLNAAQHQPHARMHQAGLEVQPTIVNNPDYRARRIAQLLKRAADAQSAQMRELEPRMNTDEHR